VIGTVAEVTSALTLEAEEVPALVEALAAYQARFAPLFERQEQRAWAALYLRGLLTAEVPRKNVEAMALHLLGAGEAAPRQVRALQQFLGDGGWDDDALLAEHQRLVEETLGEADGVLIVDDSEVPKQGTPSVGVARQWCGATGKRDNCQAGVFLAYASRRGYTLLDRRLYLPERWFEPDSAGRWRACGIPDDTPFATKPALAAQLVATLQAAGRLRARWVVADEDYGKDPVFRERVAAAGLDYLVEVACATRIWPLTEPHGQAARARPTTWVPSQPDGRRGRPPTRAQRHPDSPAPWRVDAYAAAIPEECWQRFRILEGQKGPLVADFVARRVVLSRDGLPGPEGWLLIRRSVGGPDDPIARKYYLSQASAQAPLAELVRVSGMRWPIESCFTEGKGELGLDHYETRSWRGWHHHMTLVCLAHHFLVQLQARLRPREGGHRAPPDRPRAVGGAARPAPPDPAPPPPRARRGRPAAAPHAPSQPGRRPHALTRGVASTAPRCRLGAGAPAVPSSPQLGRLSGTSPPAPMPAQ
jgi:SRSO17 transposase